jgi:integrase
MSAAAQQAAVAAAAKATGRRQAAPTRLVPESSWDELAVRAPQMVATMCSYLEQLAVSSRPSTVAAASLALRHLAAHVTETDPSCTSVAAIERRHVEDYKVALAARPGAGENKTVSATTIRHNLGMARTFFERVIDWDYPDAPRRVPIFTGDLPKADEPTPKFLDDPTAAKFMAALATDPNRRRRLIVELLARTGMRAGELGGLRDDAMYRLGDTYWLRIPLGKLHNDRSVPLHPLLIGLITDYRAWRGPSTTGRLVERDDHQPFDRRTIHRYVVAAGRRAEIDHVHPHALRHTLATQFQPGHVARSDRRHVGSSITTDDARLRPHRRHHRRRPVLHRHPRRRSRHADSDAPRRRARRRHPAPSPPRQRPLHQTARARLPIPYHLRTLRLL